MYWIHKHAIKLKKQLSSRITSHSSVLCKAYSLFVLNMQMNYKACGYINLYIFRIFWRCSSNCIKLFKLCKTHQWKIKGGSESTISASYSCKLRTSLALSLVTHQNVVTYRVLCYCKFKIIMSSIMRILTFNLGVFLYSLSMLGKHLFFPTGIQCYLLAFFLAFYYCTL